MVTRTATPDIRLNYTCVGSGPDVLLLHGWASSSRMWSPLVAGLSDRMRFWALDLYGFGDSPRPAANQPVDIRQHRTMIADFCEQHKLYPRLVIGHSMGGMLALRLALDCPERVERLMLLAPVVTGRFGNRLDLNKLVGSEWASGALMHAKPFWTLTQHVFMPLLAVPNYWYLDGQATARIVNDFKRTSWQAAAFAIQSIARENLEPELPQIKQPTQVMVGAWDTTVPPTEGRLAAARLPNAKLIELPRVRHQILDERPQQVMAVVEGFLED